MKSSICLIAVFIGITSMLCAQRNADWTAPVTGNPQAILFQSITGVPIVQTDKAYIGINPATKQVAWTVDRAADKALSGIMETSGADFYDMSYTPYVIIRNSVIDSRDGKVLLDKTKDDYKQIKDYEVIPDLNSVLVHTNSRLHLINMADNAVSWTLDLGTKSSFSLKSDDQPNLDLPIGTTLLSKTGVLIYQSKKGVTAIDSKTGKLLWTDKAEPAAVYFTPDEKHVLLVEASGSMMGAYLGYAFSKTIKAYETGTGAKPWKEDIDADENVRWVDVHPDYLVVVHKKGCNLYNYATGEKMWKRDFDGNRVVEIAPNAEGYLITFSSGYKTMQLDKTGKELWKKAKATETDDDEIEIPEEGGLDRFNYDKGVVIITAEKARFYPKKGSGAKKWKQSVDAETRVAYDPARKNIILVAKKKLLVVNPDKNPATFAEAEVDMENPEQIATVEVRNDGYYLAGEHEYIVLNPDNMNVTHHYYKPPFDSKKLLINVINTGLSVGGAVVGVVGVSNAMMGAGKATGSVVGMTAPGSGNTELNRADQQMGASNMMADVQKMMPSARFNAFKQTRDFAYFLTKDKASSEIVLVRVNKDSGTEGEKLIMGTARPVYEVDEIESRVYFVNKGVLNVFQM